MQIPAGTPDIIQFRCNICGTENQNAIRRFHREMSDCSGCGSTPRFRGIIKVLSASVLGSQMPLQSFPSLKHVRGIGLSEWDVYARVLADRFSFQNTYYHMEPRFDVMSDDWKRYKELDFIICTEVFEHVLQPVSTGLSHLRQMLKPSGVMIFSVPFTDMPHTKEHFPGLASFGLCQIDNEWVVVSKSADGHYTVFDRNVHFHGGPGTVLEMRLFGESDLLQLLTEARFQLKVYSEPDLDVGYVWPDYEERSGAGVNGSYIIEARPV